MLADRGIAVTAPPTQVRTWNLSSIWRLRTAAGPVWLKVTPPFCASEAAVIPLLDQQVVPTVLGAGPNRVLLADVAGQDQYDARGDDLRCMARMLIGVQAQWSFRVPELEALGVQDKRCAAALPQIHAVVDRNRHELDDRTRRALDHLVDGLPERFAALDACGIPDTLVHGDFHPGNVRGTLNAQPLHRQLTEPPLERRPGRADDPIDPARRLDPLRTATHQQRLTQLLVPQLNRTHLLGQPTGEPLLISAGRLAEPERHPDLLPVVLDRPAIPPVPDEVGRIDLDLLGQVDDRLRRHFLGRPRETSLDSKNFSNTANPSRVAPVLLPTTASPRRSASTTRPAHPVTTLGAQSGTVEAALTVTLARSLPCTPGQLREFQA